MKGLVRSWPFAAAIATLGLHVVLAAVFEMPGSFRKYTSAAELYLAAELPEERLMDLSPLYFDLTVAVARVVPRADPALAAVQIVLIAAAAGFLAWLLERRVGRRLAIAGALVFALDRHVLVYERVLEPEAWLLFFVLGWIFFLERTAGGAGGSRAPIVAGLLAGASLLTRPTFLPICLLAPLYLRRRCRGRWVRASLLFGGPVAIAVAVLLLRAAAVTGDPTTPVMNPGTVFYEGNNPLSRGTSAVYPPVVRALMKANDERPDIAHEHYRTVARAATGEDLSIAGVNAYWSGLAVDFIVAEPGRFLGLLRDKLLRIFHVYRWHDVEVAWRYDRTLPLPHVPFAILGSLTLLGMLYEARRITAALPFYVLAGLQTAVMLTFYVSARQRLLLLPAAIYFALVACEWLLSKEMRRSFAFYGTFLLLTLCFVLPGDLTRDDRHVREGNAAAQARFFELTEATRREPLAAHVELALDGLSRAPWVEWVPAYFPQEESTLDEALARRLVDAGGPGAAAELDRAVVFLRAGRLAEAGRLLGALAADERTVYRGAKQPSDPRFYLGRIAALEGDQDRAVELLFSALERSPGDPFVLAELIALTDDPRFREALAPTSVIDAQYLLGRALLFHGRPREAVAAFRFVVDRIPEFRTGRIYLAAALGEAGRIDDGAAQYLEAVRREPDPLFLSAQISALFRAWAARHPEDPRIRLYAAHVLHEHGRFREAARILEAIEPGGSLRPRVDDELRSVRRALEVLRGRS